MKQLEVYTARISDWRHWRNTDVLFLDTTLMSGDLTFAPTGDILWPYKRGEIDEDTYTERYYRTLQQRIQNDYRPWKWLVYQEAVCLACYCQRGKFCHRHLLKRPVKYICDQEGIAFLDRGEIVW